MTPVINPWVFYLMPICENVRDLAFILTILGSCTIAGLGLGGIFASVDGFDELKETIVKYIKKLLPIVVIAALLHCLIPTEETLTKMLIAQNVTVDRVDVAFDTVVNVYNDIMNLFSESGAANG